MSKLLNNLGAYATTYILCVFVVWGLRSVEESGRVIIKIFFASGRHDGFAIFDNFINLLIGVGLFIGGLTTLHKVKWGAFCVGVSLCLALVQGLCT